MGFITLLSLLITETFFIVWSIVSKNNRGQEKSIVRISELIIFGLLLITGVFSWGFRYITLLLILIIQSVIGIFILIRKKEKVYKTSKNILSFIRNCVLYIMALSLAILCPQYEQPKTTGNYEIATATYTWTDLNRIEEFSDTGENRALTVEFWYPENADGEFPLVVFSHGAFGYSGSNYSTFAELASNGYVVASIGHPYHSFFTKDTRGKITTANTDFISSVYEINEINDENNTEKVYNTTRIWLKLRIDDQNFVINNILELTGTENEDSLFSIINIDKIGLIGHSLGGASSAQLGRERDDIDAVIVLDGTMLGEEVAYENGSVILNKNPYPVPILNIYAESHYTGAKELAGDEYENFHAIRGAVNAYEVIFNDAGHLDFTDLPLFSPILAKQLGVGAINKRYCIETMNDIVLKFFNGYLKDGGNPQFEKEY
ncbi:MAG: alpha/beta hydrolase family protein [Eubacteriales bacterium]